MSYRNKTYVIFDGDNDMWAYGYMKGWIKNKKIDFNFHDAHAINEIRNGTQEATVKRKLRERLKGTKQAIVLVGESTKNLYRYVRWEIQVCQELGIPIVVVNLNDKRTIDHEFCPAILRDITAIHVSFNARIIKKALDEWCPFYSEKKSGNNWKFTDQAYKDLGL